MFLDSNKPAPDHAKRIRVAIAQPALPLYRIEVFRRIANLDAFDVCVFHGKEPGLDNADPTGFKAVKVHDVYWKVPLAGRVIIDATPVRICWSKEFDIVILSWNLRNPFLIPGLLTGWFTGKPTLLWGHGRTKRPAPFRDWLRSRIANLSSGVILYDHKTAELMRSSRAIRCPVFVAPNALAVNASLINQEDGQPSADTSSHQGAKRFVLLHVSRLQKANRLDVAIESLQFLRQKFPLVKLVCVGGSVDGERERLARLAEELGVSDLVDFAGPIFDEEKLAKLFRQADLFIYPSNVGLSLLHAFAYGLPAIVGDNWSGHNPEISAFEEGVNGFSFRDGDPHHLCEQLSRVIEDPELRLVLSSNATETAAKDHSIDAMVAGFQEAIMERFLSKRGLRDDTEAV